MTAVKHTLPTKGTTANLSVTARAPKVAKISAPEKKVFTAKPMRGPVDYEALIRESHERFKKVHEILAR